MKAQHQNLSVCEIGATIGRMWRELKDEQKQKYNDDFTQAKVSIGYSLNKLHLFEQYIFPMYLSALCVATVYKLLPGLHCFNQTFGQCTRVHF